MLCHCTTVQAVVYMMWSLTLTAVAPLGEKKECMGSKIKFMEKTSSVRVESPFLRSRWNFPPLLQMLHPHHPPLVHGRQCRWKDQQCQSASASASVPECQSALPICATFHNPISLLPLASMQSIALHSIHCNVLQFYPRWKTLFRPHTLQCTECSTWDKTQCSAQWYLARWIIVGQCSVSQQSLSLSLCGHSSSSSSTPTSNAS